MSLRFLCIPLVALLSLFVLACEGNIPSVQFRNVSAEGWRSADTLHFDFDSIPASGTYAVTLSLRTSSAPSYPYLDLTLALRRDNSGKVGVPDSLCVALNKENGTPVGRGVTLYQHDFCIDTLQLQQADHLHYTITHCMRRSPLPGIHDVGLSLEEVRP